MPKTTGPTRERKVILDAIRDALATARKDDAAFLAEFRARAGARMSTGEAGGGARSTGSATRGGGARSLGLPTRGEGGRRPSSKGARLDADPRYLANARALAKRTAKNARIIGGTKVAGKQFDDCVAVGDDEDFGCTGTLIAPNVVLTAGHCEALHTRIFVGNDTSKRGRVYRVKEAVVHPQWDEALNNDLMLLILDKPVTGVTPRKLATSAIIDKASDARVVGFGTTDLAGTTGYGIKQQTDVPIVSPSCKGKVSGTADSTVYGCHAGKELVAGKPLLLRDTCRGDSGGPLYIAGKQGQWLLAGVTSRGTDLSTTMCGDGGTYTRVDKYKTWIAQTITRHGG